MPRPATILPTAEDLFARLDRPPWYALSSVELSKLLGCHLNTIWNWGIRGTGPPPEPPAAHVRASNRRFFLPCHVLTWLSAREGAPVPAWAWVKRWLVERRLHSSREPDPDPAETMRLVRLLEWDAAGFRKSHPPRWRPRRPRHLASLEADVAAAAGDEPGCRMVA